MDPVSALVIACVVSWCIARASAEAAMDQARAEAREAASAIRDGLRGRQDAWAERLADRLADGRKGGPSTALWWGWAAARTARAVRAAVRREPRTAERQRAVRGTTGPFRRVWDAGVRGARFARDEARRQRDAQQPRTSVPVGVCGRCGAVTARAALVWALTRSGTQEQMCAKCRAATEAERKADEEARQEPTRPAPEVTDADVVDARPRSSRPRPELASPPAQPAEPPRVPKSPPPPPPAAPQFDRTPDVPSAPSTPPKSVIEAPVTEGELMPPRQPGQIVPRRTHAPATRGARGNGGESYTHGQWNRAVADIEDRLKDLPATLEAMLQRLTTADAGRSQVQGVLALRDDIDAFMGLVRHMLDDVNRRESPILTAVQVAGGPEEIAGIAYLGDV